MKDCLYEFEEKISKIKAYLAYLEYEQQIINMECQYGQIACSLYTSKELIKSIDKKIIDYNALIISLYGAFENYVEVLLKEYLILLNEIVKEYDMLPENLKNQHFDNSIILIQKLDERKYRMLDKNNIISNLYGCINKEEGYSINYDALLMHNSNMWPDTINDLFKCVGISDLFTRIKNLDFFIEFYKDRHELENKKSTINILNRKDMNEVLRPIKELIEERNRIAHSWVDSMDISLVKEYLEFISNIGTSLYLILENEMCKYQKDFSSIDISVEEVIRDKVLILKLNEVSIKIGNKVIIEKGNGELSFGEVESIKSEDNQLEASELGQEVGVITSYSGKLKKNYKYYLVKY